jgi:AmmeMemoRadiSam system protein B
MLVCERPRLRPYVQSAQVHNDHRHIYLIDQLGLAEAHRLTLQEFHWVRLFDGQRSLRDIQVEHLRQHGQLTPLEGFFDLVRRLEDKLFLDTPRFHEVVKGPIRRPRHHACYGNDPELARRQFQSLFTRPHGPGLPELPQPDESFRAALLPHIDFARGGVSYAWGFKEVFERSNASLFVIIGTSHHSCHRFTLTRKNFQTPWGVVPTDQDYIDRLVGHYGDGLFDDELLAHLPEHSIEFEVVFLHYLYEKVRPIRIVPLVIGSFHDCTLGGVEPKVRSDIGRMIEALRQVEAETHEPICYIISGDLAHIGPDFGARQPVHAAQLRHSRQQDLALLHHAQKGDPAGYFEVLSRENDARNICGFPPTYLVLEALRPSGGKVLHYDQYVHPRGNQSVSYASMSFHR